MNCKTCNRYRVRKTRPYGQAGGMGWHCRQDRCYGADVWDINPKRERRKGRRETEKQLGETHGND